MDNLVIAVIAIAVVQALTILLTIGREREIKRLRELVAEQRILIVEIRAWLTGRMQSAETRRIKPDREPIADDMRVPEPAITRVREPARCHSTMKSRRVLPIGTFVIYLDQDNPLAIGHHAKKAAWASRSSRW